MNLPDANLYSDKNSKLETEFLKFVVSAPIQCVTNKWCAAAPLVHALLRIANRPLCGATTDDGEQSLKTLACRLPITRSPEVKDVNKINFLLSEGPLEEENPWRQVLRHGTIVIAIGAREACPQYSNVFHLNLKIGAGLSICFPPSEFSIGECDPQRQLLEYYFQNSEALERLEVVLSGLQNRFAHLQLSVDAIERNEAAKSRVHEQLQTLLDSLSWRCIAQWLPKTKLHIQEIQKTLDNWHRSE